MALSQFPFLVMAGNIGSGKSTLTEKLGQHLGFRTHFESVQDNPYLEDFYTEMNRWSFPLQVYFLTHRFNTHRNILASKHGHIQDRSIYEDAFVFARALHEQGQMSTRDYKNYLQLFDSMVQLLDAPNLLIYLHRSVPKLVERIRLRGRDYEQEISEQYLEHLNKYYWEWFHSYNLGQTLFIETDDLDFLHNENHFNYLVERIMKALDDQGIQVGPRSSQNTPSQFQI